MAATLSAIYWHGQLVVRSDPGHELRRGIVRRAIIPPSPPFFINKINILRYKMASL